jgi:hypothetical protein
MNALMGHLRQVSDLPQQMVALRAHQAGTAQIMWDQNQMVHVLLDFCVKGWLKFQIPRTLYHGATTAPAVTTVLGAPLWPFLARQGRMAPVSCYVMWHNVRLVILDISARKKRCSQKALTVLQVSIVDLARRLRHRFPQPLLHPPHLAHGAVVTLDQTCPWQYGVIFAQLIIIVRLGILAFGPLVCLHMFGLVDRATAKMASILIRLVRLFAGNVPLGTSVKTVHSHEFVPKEATVQQDLERLCTLALLEHTVLKWA